MSKQFDTYLEEEMNREDNIDIMVDDNNIIDGFFKFDDEELCKSILTSPIFDDDGNVIDDGAPDIEFDNLINKKSPEEE